MREQINKINNWKRFLNEQKSYDDYNKIQFNRKSEYQDLTFKCVNLRKGL